MHHLLVAPLGYLFRSHFTLIHGEKVSRLRRVLPSHIMEGGGCDVICLALPDQAVVLEKVLLLRGINVTFRLEDTLCFSPLIM